MKNVLAPVSLGRTGLRVSRLGMGVLPIGPNQRSLPVERGAQIIAHALARGINFIDTAEYYRAYDYIKKALRGGGEDAVICSKSLASDRCGMARALEAARRALNRDTIDVFLLHEVRAGQFAERAAAWDFLCEARERGLIKAAGVSTHNVDVAAAMAAVPECDAVFALVNYAGLGVRRGDGPAAAAEMEEALRLCRDAGKGVFSMKAFGGGNLTVDYQRALGYALSLSQVDSVMIGFSAEKEIDEAIDFLTGKMPASYAPDVSRKRMMIEEDSCEGCGRCLKACQSGAIYYGKRGLARIDEQKCLTCGYCAPVCPVRAIVLL